MKQNFQLHGKLSAGYGSMWGMVPTRPGDKIGPEFTIGLTMEEALDGPVLIVKAAWGGKSLHTDFRSPSAGPYQLSSFQLENYPKQEGHGIPKGRVRQMRHFLESNHKDHANADGKMTEEQKRDFLAKFEADLIGPADVALWERGASNAGYHYLGCAKTFAQIGKAFAEANLRMLESRQ